MRPVGQKQGMVLPRMVQARWCCRQDGDTDICSAADDGAGLLGTKLGTVSMALCYRGIHYSMCHLWARGKVLQYQVQLHGTWQWLADQQVYGCACWWAVRTCGRSSPFVLYMPEYRHNWYESAKSSACRMHNGHRLGILSALQLP